MSAARQNRPLYTFLGWVLMLLALCALAYYFLLAIGGGISPERAAAIAEYERIERAIEANSQKYRLANRPAGPALAKFVTRVRERIAALAPEYPQLSDFAAKVKASPHGFHYTKGKIHSWKGPDPRPASKEPPFDPPSACALQFYVRWRADDIRRTEVRRKLTQEKIDKFKGVDPRKNVFTTINHAIDARATLGLGGEFPIYPREAEAEIFFMANGELPSTRKLLAAVEAILAEEAASIRPELAPLVPKVGTPSLTDAQKKANHIPLAGEAP